MQAFRLHSYDVVDASGYGVVFNNLLNALENHQELHIFSNAHNVINFCKPTYYEFDSYTIGYTPWETTEIPEAWIGPMLQVDQLWTTANWLKDLYEERLQREVWVLPHGLAKVWKPIKHSWPEYRPFTFLHMGDPAIRKGLDALLSVWHRHFQYNDNVQLVVKSVGPSISRVKTSSAYSLKNVQVIEHEMHPAEIWQLYALTDALIYPSRGEGFGLIPFEALGSGLPTVLPAKHMGDYADAYGIKLNDSVLVDAPEDYYSIHPGKWLEHNEDELINTMEQLIANYNHYAVDTFEDALDLQEFASWEHVADIAAENLLNI